MVLRDFHADLYPDTTGYTTELTASQWMEGKNIPVAKISLDPAKREKNEEPITVCSLYLSLHLHLCLCNNYFNTNEVFIAFCFH